MKRNPFITMIVLLGLLLGSWVAGPSPSPASLAAPAAVTYYVREGGSSSPDCLSWDTACELQDALGVAVVGDEIWVAAGTYKPTTGNDRFATFQLVSGVELYGGFPATGEPGWDDRDPETRITILSGDLQGDDGPDFANYGDNSYHVVTGGSTVTETAVLDGFTISGGNANGSDPYNRGGGMYNLSNSSPTLTNVTFSGNRAGWGGGMANDASSPVLTNTTFISNTATTSGGGMYNNDHSSPTLSNCTFAGNLAVYGGGMRNAIASSPTLTNVTFSGNTGNWGGGMANAASSPTLTNTTFISNMADTSGGGIYNKDHSHPRLSNCTFAGNSARFGGGLRNIDSSSPTLTNCTFAANSATEYGGGMANATSSSPTLRNCILWGNVAPSGAQFSNSESTPKIGFSDIQGSGGSGVWTTPLGTDLGGNIDADPLFVDQAAGDLHLHLDSPAADRGNNDDATVTTDLDGNPRIHNGRVDMGAYEFQYPAPPNPIYVDVDATGTRDGSNWTDALTSLRAALCWAGAGVTEHGQQEVEIWVAEGVYTPIAGGGREATFELHSGVAAYGGFHTTEAPDWDDRDWVAYPSILSGDLMGDDAAGFVNYGDNSYNVVTGSGVTETAVVDGFIVSGGNANVIPVPREWGGGMYLENGSPTIRHVTFRGNTANAGGGMFIDGGQPVLVNVEFSQNRATVNGGGMHTHHASSPTLTDVTFSGNTATQGGGAMYNRNSSPALTNCILWGNVAQSGAQLYNSISTPDIAFSDIQGSGGSGDGWDTALGADGGGNIDADPLFVEPVDPATAPTTAGDLRLQLTSPAIDAGNNEAPGLSGILTDLGGHPRFADVATVVDTGQGAAPIVDMGAYEAPPSTIHVDQAASGENNGSSWADAFTDLQDALTWAVDGVQVWVAEGIYLPTTGTARTASFQLVSGVAVYGGFHATEAPEWDDRDWVAYVTILSGDIGTEGVNSDNSYHVVTGSGTDASAMLDGFIVTGGNANLASDHWGWGGGMYVENGSPTIRHVVFQGNTANGGGGMFNDGGQPVLVDVEFSHNSATTSGGGMYNEGSSPLLSYFALSDNAANGHGGGMYNEGSNPTLVIGVVSGNRADADDNSDGQGGGIYNLGGSPDLINVTMSGNSAYVGGGMANLEGATLSRPKLLNTIVWGNSADGGSPQIYDPVWTDPEGPCLVEGGYSGCGVEDTASPFADADGADDVPGTADDDLRLVGASHAIDAGDKAHLPQDVGDLDGDGDSIEKLPYDLAGGPRCYADQAPLDGTIDGEPDPCASNDVDLGAYEAACPAWHMHYGADWLAEGQDYRLGFHHEIDDPSTVTISDTLASYAAERAAGNLANARDAYGFALDCATTVTETNEALAGLLKVIWEQATGALLEGNEEMVTALDLTDAGGMAIEITALETAIDKYTEATDGYLLPLAGEHQGDFLAAMGISRTHQLTYTEAITQVDVQRLAAASAKKSQATLELAERQFRSGDRTPAEETLRQGKAQATVELTLLEEIWPGVVEDVNYHALLRNLSDMDRLLGFLVGDKNPLGYSPEWIPIHYTPGDPLYPNNYLKINALAKEKLGEGDQWGAQDVIDEAKTESQKVHDEYSVMQQRYADIEAEYDAELVTLCGADWERCGEGTIGEQISAVEQAQRRLGRVLEEMNVNNKRIQFKVEARAKAAGIYEATAELISTKGEVYKSMVEQEEEIALGWQIAKGVGGFVSNMVYNRAIGAMAFGRKGVLGFAGGTLAGLGGSIDMLAGFFGVEEEPPKEEKLLEFQAWQNGQMVICDGQIADVEFETSIKELFLEYGALDIDYAIALENLHQELIRLDGMKTRVEYLLAEKARAMAFTTLLYRDPAHRVLRDYYMELAQDSYDTALDYTFRAGRALEYEANLASAELTSPDPDEMFGIRNIVTLITARADSKTAYDDWSADKTPQPRTTVVRLSRALNYEDNDTGTAEEQFNAYVVRNPANRSDEDGDGVAESLRFTFDTSIFKGNPFFDYCLFNDRIESVQVRLRGENLGLDSVTVRLGWGDVGCADTDCGTTFIRSEGAFSEEDPDGSGYLDDLRAYKVQPKSATIQAAAGDAAFPEPANTDLALRSVACPYWVFKFPGDLPANAGFNLDKVDEIELIITHKAYSLQAPMCLGASSLRLAPSREYRPMERVLDPGSSPLLVALAEDRSPSAGDAATSLSGLYAGTVAITSPQYMPALDMNLVLTATGSSLTGYLDAAQSLHVPVVDEATGRGPAVSGSWSGEGFSLESELFTTTLSAGLPVTRQVILHSGVISNSGEYLTGLYSETLAGLTPQPMVIDGDVELWRLPAAVAPSASFAAFPVVGPVALTVTFSDFSTGDPTGWAWDFGDEGSSAEQNPTYTYTAIGTYTVTLTVSNTLGADRAVMPSYITVLEPQAPEAHFSADPTSGMVPLTVTFTDQSSNYPTAWFWDFGDGGRSTERLPVHVYNAAGTFTVSLTVSNTVGSNTLTVPGFITVEQEKTRIYLPLVIKSAP